MHTEKRTLFALLPARLITTWLSLLALATGMHGQQSGWNAAILSGSNTSSSFAFVDAAAFGSCTTNCDICTIISNAFTTYSTTNSNGVVVDARGFTPPFQCGSSPWQTIYSKGSLSNVVLLPAGSIPIQKTWILPDDTHLIGEGPNLTIAGWIQAM